MPRVPRGYEIVNPLAFNPVRSLYLFAWWLLCFAIVMCLAPFLAPLWIAAGIWRAVAHHRRKRALVAHRAALQARINAHPMGPVMQAMAAEQRRVTPDQLVRQIQALQR